MSDDVNKLELTILKEKDGAHIQATGIPASGYNIQATTNLNNPKDWLTVVTNAAKEWTDTAVTNTHLYPHGRFYRGEVIVPPATNSPTISTNTAPGSGTPTHANPVTPTTYSDTLTWPAVTNCPPGYIKGYNLYYGVGRSLTNKLTLGNVTSATVSGLLPNLRYDFQLTSVNKIGEESEPSNIVSTNHVTTIGHSMADVIAPLATPAVQQPVTPVKGR